MLFAGIDVGAQSVKAALFDGKKILGVKVIITEEETDSAAREVYEGLLAELGLQAGDVERVLATGWGANDVSFADGKSSEQICAARAGRWLVPTARTVLDMGYEGCRAMKLGPDGTLEDFANNPKCASGTGAFIELGALYLKVPLAEMGPLALAAYGAADVSSTCAVFARSEVARHLRRGAAKANILGGLHAATADRVFGLLKRVGIEADFVISGGIAKNIGVAKRVKAKVGLPAHISEEPQLIGALGAAFFA